MVAVFVCVCTVSCDCFKIASLSQQIALSLLLLAGREHAVGVINSIMIGWQTHTLINKPANQHEGRV